MGASGEDILQENQQDSSESLNLNDQAGVEAVESEVKSGSADADENQPRIELPYYIVHVQSQYENKAKLALEEVIKKKNLGHIFGQILLPKEEVTKMVAGKRRKISKKFFPGYLIIQMEFSDESWPIVRGIPKITGFVGDKNNPPQLSGEEVLRLTSQISDGVIKTKAKVDFEKGDSLRVIDGPFSNFSGIVDEVKPEKGKVKVLVSIFGRATPVELDFSQVERSE